MCRMITTKKNSRKFLFLFAQFLWILLVLKKPNSNEQLQQIQNFKAIHNPANHTCHMVELTKRGKRYIQMSAYTNKYDLFIPPLFIHSSGSRDIKYTYKYAMSTQFKATIAVHCGVFQCIESILSANISTNIAIKNV